MPYERQAPGVRGARLNVGRALLDLAADDVLFMHCLPAHRGEEISLDLLGLAMKELPLGTAYAIWTGVGAVGTVIAGIILFGESMALFRLASVAGIERLLCGPGNHQGRPGAALPGHCRRLA